MFEQQRLNASERPRIAYRYTVYGSGTFPLDMLRHDQCWPTDGGGLEPSREKRTVYLASYRAPTNDRWSSFGWIVDFVGGP